MTLQLREKQEYLARIAGEMHARVPDESADDRQLIADIIHDLSRLDYLERQEAARIARATRDSVNAQNRQRRAAA